MVTSTATIATFGHQLVTATTMLSATLLLAALAMARARVLIKR